MTPRGFLAPRSLAARKPPHGSPCTRCGLCCIATLCELARSIFHQTSGPCPALVWEGENSACGLVVASQQHAPDYAKAAALVIGSGDGCDCRINGEPINNAFNARLAAQDIARADEIAKARDLLGLPKEPQR